MAATTIIAESPSIASSVRGEENTMTVEDRFRGRYKARDIGQADFNLVQTVTGTPIKPCNALDIGCGTGDNAIWLALHGFDVMESTRPSLQLKQRRRRLRRAVPPARFLAGNFLTSQITGATFGFSENGRDAGATLSGWRRELVR
jgi:hypothetical protein